MIDCIPLNGHITLPPFKKQPAAWNVFTKLGFTVVRVYFDEPLEPHDSDKKPYCIRLVVKPQKLNHGVESKKFRITEDGAGINIQPCEIYCQRWLVERIKALLGETLGETEISPSEVGVGDKSHPAATLWDELVTNGFECEGHTVRYDDQRITIVTAADSLVASNHMVGSADFSMVRAAGKDSPNYAHMWYAGLKYFWHDDPVRAAVLTYKCFRESAPLPEKAKTSLEVAESLEMSLSKICFGIDVLVGNGYLDTKDQGQKYYCKKTVSDKDLIFDKDFLTVAMSKAVLTGKKGGAFFPARGFVIQFKLYLPLRA